MPTAEQWARTSPEQKRRHAERVTRYVQDNPEKHREWSLRAYWRRKLRAIELLGGRCAGCGTDNPLVLTVNHRHEGAKPSEVGRIGLTGSALWQAALRSPEPLRHYDLRCHNCQAVYEHKTGRRSLPNSEEFSHLVGFLPG